jgi:hypothetical protein
MSRKIIKSKHNNEQDEGLGAKVRRSIGGREVFLFLYFGLKKLFFSKVPNFDPFLLFDEVYCQAPAGLITHIE